MAENMGNTDEQVEVITAAQTEDVTDKKCPNCGATVVYDPETLSMTCPFCGYSRTLPKPEDNDPYTAQETLDGIQPEDGDVIE